MPFNYKRWTEPTMDALRQAGKIAASTACDLGRFLHKHRETAVGGIGGYALGRVIESIPFIGRMLAPLAGTLLGVGGGLAGYQRELERRRLEALERGQR